MTIKAKIIGLVVVSLSILTISIAIFSVNKAQESLLEQNYAALTSARDGKSEQIKNFFAERIGDINVLSKSSDVENIIYDLKNTMDLVDYEENGAFPVNEMVVQDATKTHEPFFQNYMTEYGYYDIFIITADSGHVIYTAAKESDYGANLKSGNLKESGLGEVWSKTLVNKRPTFVDMRPYAPSNDAPAMFLGTPVLDNGTVSAVLVFQISDRSINKIMQFRKGYGDSQEDYLVGSDKLMRSDSYLDPKGHSLKASFAAGANVDTVASNNAIAGKSNTEIVIDYNGNPVLSAYGQVEIGQDIKWAILSEIDEAEVMETPTAIRNMIIIISLALLAFVVLGAIVVINNIVVKRLIRFQEGLVGFFNYVNRESNEVKELESDSIDEIGLMAQVVNENIKKAQKGIEEDRAIIDETIRVLGEFEQGDLHQRITTNVHNQALNELKNVLNNMGDNLERNIDNILKVLDEFSQYNYLNKVDTTGIKEHLEKLAIGVNSLGSSTTQMLVENKKNGLIMDNSSNVLLENVDLLNQASTEAAASLEETAAALEEITGNITQTTDKIAQMTSFAQKVTSSANEGEVNAKRTTEAMDEINGQVTAINEAITVIDQIAFQTNILSLNAAVEAATAGEAGRGFAVVAQEVRNLAGRSAEAAKEIKELVENANIKANEGKNIADSMIEGYGTLNANISQTIELISDISVAAQEQQTGIVQINDAINSLDSQTQQNASVANQTKDIALETSELAKGIVSSADEKEFEGKNSIDISKEAKSNKTKSLEKVAVKPVTPTKKHSKIVKKEEPKEIVKNEVITANNNDEDEWESF